MWNYVKGRSGHMETATPALMLAIVLGIAAYGMESAPGWVKVSLWVAAGAFGLIGLVMIVSGADKSPFAANFEASLMKEQEEKEEEK